jgi:hypothetical protein
LLSGARIEYFCEKAGESFAVGLDEIQLECQESAEAIGNSTCGKSRRVGLQIARKAKINGENEFFIVLKKEAGVGSRNVGGRGGGCNQLAGEAILAQE